MIEVDPASPAARRLWRKVAELAYAFGPDEEWCLVGGLMVQLHAYEHASVPRPTSDIDILGDARKQPSTTERLSRILQALNAEMKAPPPTDPTLGYQFEVDGEIVEVLGPDGLRGQPRTLGGYETIKVDGGTQALRRAELVQVSVADDPPVPVRRPSLLGAILLKARALSAARDKKAEHREDLIRLLGFVEDARALAEAGDFRETERKWLRRIESDLDPSGSPDLRRLFSEGELRRAQQVFKLLAR